MVGLAVYEEELITEEEGMAVFGLLDKNNDETLTLEEIRVQVQQKDVKEFLAKHADSPLGSHPPVTSHTCIGTKHHCNPILLPQTIGCHHIPSSSHISRLASHISSHIKQLRSQLTSQVVEQ